MVSKTKAEVHTITLRSVPIAGASGATTTDDVLQPSDERVDGQHEGGDVKLIQLTSDVSGNTNLTPMDNSIRVNADDRPSPGFALKKRRGQKVTSTKEQKDILAAFYENQRTSGIRANPADVIEAMKAAGVPPLKESQIKGWWRTYHRKQRQIAEDMIEGARNLRSQQEGTVPLKIKLPPSFLIFRKETLVSQDAMKTVSSRAWSFQESIF